METEVKINKIKKFSSYTHSEARTGAGQLVEFTCPSGSEEKIKEFFLENLRGVSLPNTAPFNMSHGSYGKYTRYKMEQHKYAAGRTCFIEMLEISNPPDKRCGFVIYEYQSYGDSAFSEWETLKDALEAWEKHWGSFNNNENFPKLSGFKRYVECGALDPWFYSVGDEEIIGDYAMPYGLEDDPVYRLGKKFVVIDDNEVPHIKTCMGTRFIFDQERGGSHQEKPYRIVYWDDGGTWNENNHEDRKHLPRELRSEELWITEAIKQFQALLTGKNTDFVINFTDRTKFIGKIVEIDKNIRSPEGNYLLSITFKDGRRKKKEGWVNNFVPTPEVPDVIQFAIQEFKKKDIEVEHVEIKERKGKKDGKKWEGAFFNR